MNEAIVNAFAKDVDPRFIIGPTKLGAMMNRSRWWAQDLLRSWWIDQQNGGPVRVFRRRISRGRMAYATTMNVLDAVFGRRDRATERRITSIERDLERAFARIAELEQRIGRRR